MSHIKFRKLNEFAMIPVRGSDGAAGFDLCANLYGAGEGEIEGRFSVSRSLRNITRVGFIKGIKDAVARMRRPKQARMLIDTGISMEIPEGFFGMIKPRSGLANKHGIDVMAGVIDSDYRGEVKVLLINHGYETFKIKHGDRIAQIIFMPYVGHAVEVLESTETARGAGGFGSTGQ